MNTAQKTERKKVIRLQSHVTLYGTLLRKAYTPFVGHNLFSYATISYCRKVFTPYTHSINGTSTYLCTNTEQEKANNNNRSGSGKIREEKTESQSIERKGETRHSMCNMRLAGWLADWLPRCLTDSVCAVCMCYNKYERFFLSKLYWRFECETDWIISTLT